MDSGTQDSSTKQYLHGDILRSSNVTDVDPTACIPLTLTRPIAKGGVFKLMRSFAGKMDQCTGPGSDGISAALE